MPSPAPGASSTSVVSASPATSTSLCPTPTVSTSTTSQPGSVEHAQRLGRAPRQTAEVAARGHRPDVDVAVERVVLHPHPVAQQRAARERRGRVDRQHAHALARLAQLADQRVGGGGLADPWRPGDAHDLRLPGVRRQGRHHLAQLRRLVLDPGDQPRDRAGVTLAGAGDQLVDRAPDDAGTRRRSSVSRPPRPSARGRARSGRRPGRRRRRARPRRRRRRAACSSRARCSTMRAPDMPTGWPSAMAPPLTLTLSSEMPS